MTLSKLTRRGALSLSALLFAASFSHASVDAGLVFDLTGASSKTINALCSQLLSSPSSSASFFAPWDQLEEMRRNGVDAKLRQLFASGGAELLAGIFYDIDLRLATDDILHSQIKRFKMLAESVSGAPVYGFYPGGLKPSARALAMLKKLDFKYALSDESLIGEAIEARRLQAFLMPDSLLLYSVSAGISKAASLPPAAGWLEEFVRTAGVICGDVAGSIPGGSVVIHVSLADYTEENIADFFAALRKMNIKSASIGKLSLKEPAYFRELPSITEVSPGSLGGFQKLFLEEWRKFQSMASEFPAGLCENIYKMGHRKFFESSHDPDVIAEMLKLTQGFYDFAGSFEFSLDAANVLAVSSGYFRIYFSADNLNPVLIALPSEGLIIAGNPLGKKDDYALKTYFNFRVYEKGWDIKTEAKEGYWRISAVLKDAPLEMKKTFVLTKDKDSFKYYCSLQNIGESPVSCDVALSVQPAGKPGIYMKSSGGEFSGSFRSSSKDFGQITELSFPLNGKAPALKFVANYPHFLTIRESSAEVSYRKKELAPSDRLLTEAHFSYGDFSPSENAKELFSYSDIFLDGVPSEKFWSDADRVIDPRRDGPEGADITDLYYARGPDCSYIFAEGDFSKTLNFYIARKGKGSDILYSKLKAPDDLLYYVKIPLTQGSPSAYKWEGVWLNTFEKGFSMYADKSVELRLPMLLPKDEWVIYLESGGKIGDSADFEVK
ncbi:MAG: hypothetical protein COS41_06470 [Elusimicrobia bacterium CG03_land_8_20_14_0_80_50_18]|nr:MAG: hypothetical protein COS41_06470 [Elusimicrobia bacterium CG03_land_8_20_14_0_80_50_18]